MKLALLKAVTKYGDKGHLGDYHRNGGFNFASVAFPQAGSLNLILVV